MNKQTAFEWGWNGYTPQPDPLMTRARMARMMRAWRRAAIQGEKIVEFKLIVRAPGHREYSVCSTQYNNEAHTVVVRT